ncbi:hypothetical protein LINPERHAP1_LOCUS5965, partial [Linum perenne]
TNHSSPARSQIPRLPLIVSSLFKPSFRTQTFFVFRIPPQLVVGVAVSSLTVWWSAADDQKDEMETENQRMVLRFGSQLDQSLKALQEIGCKSKIHSLPTSYL